MFANSCALSALPSARLVNSEPPAHNNTLPAPTCCSNNAPSPFGVACQREHEAVIGHAQRPLLGLVVGFELERPDIPQQRMRAGRSQCNLLRHVERAPTSFLLIIFGSSSSSSSSCAFLGRTRVLLANALRQRRVVEACLARLARFELDRGQRFDFDHRAGGTPRCPARLIQQRGVDEQRVSASNPAVERTELIAVKDFHAGNERISRLPRGGDVELGQRRNNARERNAPRHRNCAAIRTGRVPVAAPFGGGRSRGIGVRIQRWRRTQPQTVERGERSERQQESDAAFAHQCLPAARRANLSSRALAEVTVPSSCSSGGGLLP